MPSDPPDLAAWSRRYPHGTEVVYIAEGDRPIRATVSGRPWFRSGQAVVELAPYPGRFEISKIRRAK